MIDIEEIWHGDCFELMKNIPDKTVNLVLTDPPYNITSNKWDTQIPLDKMWEELLRISVDNAAFIFTASQPFSSMLVMSKVELFKHEWIWIKNRGSNFANTVREPFKEHEHVLVFSRGGWTYNKQMQPRTGAGSARTKYKVNYKSKSENYREFEGRENQDLTDLRVPSSWQKFNTDTSGLHPTIKPLELFKYMIRTYSNENDIVFDPFLGSGTTALASKLENRSYIGIEKEDKYIHIINDRLNMVNNSNV